MLEIRTYTRKQAGVIYSAVKRGDVEAPQAVISEMYELVGYAEVANTNQGNHVQNFSAGIKNAIDSIFSNDYDTASMILGKLATA